MYRPKPIYGSVVHGWKADFGDAGQRRIKSAPLFVWNDRHRQQAEAQGIPNVVTLGSPFSYLNRALNPGSDSPPAGSGTLFFPFHSAERTEIVQDHARLISLVEKSEPGPYTASLFYQDLLQPGVQRCYEEAGWRIVSFGARSNALFLVQLYSELLAHESVVANRLSTSLWYAGLLRRRIRVIGPAPIVRGVQLATSDDQLARRWPKLYSVGLNGTDALHEARSELGDDFLRSRSELPEVLGWRSWRTPTAWLVGKLIDARIGQGARLGEP